MLTRISRIALLGALLLPHLYSQTDSARISGTVTDASGAVLPGAIVNIKNEKTGQLRKIVTGEGGQYLAASAIAFAVHPDGGSDGNGGCGVYRSDPASGSGTHVGR